MINRFIGGMTVIALALLAACGGGGGGDGGSSATAPSITTQPASVSISDGGSASFSVAASGTAPLSYQWRRGGASITGATAATYTLNPAAVADSGAVFSVVVSNSAGSATSNNATLTVNAVPLAITTQPASVSISDGGPASFSVAASGTAPLSYQWRRGGANISGATNATYTLNPASLADNGVLFSVVVSNASSSVTSSDAALTVNAVAPAITAQPGGLTRTDGASATFSVTATGSAPLSYQWKRNAANIGGATSDSYTIAGVVPANEGDTFAVTVTNTAGSATSSNALLHVTLIPPSISTQPASQTVLENAPATFTVNAAGSSTLHFAWKRGGSPAPGATDTNTYTVASAAYPADNGAVFTVDVSNAAAGGTTVTSSAATLTVTQTVFGPTIQTQPAAQAVLEGDPATFSVALTPGSTAPFTYQWQNNSVDMVGETNATLTINPASFSSNNGHNYRVKVTNSVNTATSNQAALTVVKQELNLLAGNPGGPGETNGVGAVARFNFPTSVGVDGAGNTYVADFANQEIRKILADGTVSTLAGQRGQGGNQTGVGSAARFSNPRGVAVASDGTVYVADQSNNWIRKIATDGTVSNVVTSGLVTPVAVALSGTSNILYIVEEDGARISAVNVTASYPVTPVVVSGTGVEGSTNGTLAASTYTRPGGIAVDTGALGANATDDVLYIVDSGNTVIRKADRGGDSVTTLAGGVGDFSYADGDGANARFNYPLGAVLVGGSTGSLYIADYGNDLVRKIDLSLLSSDSGYVSTVAGIYGVAGNDGGNAGIATFNLPFGIAANAGGTLLMTSDWGSNVIRKIDISGVTTVSNLAGDPTTRGYANGTGTAALFNYPRGVAADSSGNTYVADSISHIIRKVTPAGVASLVAGTPGVIGGADGAVLSASFNNPTGVAVDASAANIYVADRANSAIRKINGGLVSTIAAFGDGIGLPHNLALNNANGDLYVANTGFNNIVKIAAVGGAITVVAGTGTAGSTGDGGPAIAATFNAPLAVAIDGNTLYVADGSFRIRKIDLVSGLVTAFVGTDGVSGSQNGTGAAAQFGYIDGLATDSSHNVYVAEPGYHQIRKVTAAGVATTLVGDSQVGVRTGSLPGSLNLPSGVATAPAAVGTRLVLSDGVEHAILEAIVKP